MYRTLAVLFTCLFTSMCSLAQAADGRSSRIEWQTNYDAAVKIARASSKPILLLFTGSDWCTWCIKLENEVFNTPEFAEAAGDKFVFVKLDFPLNKSLPADQTAQNKELQKKFSVPGFPTVIILDSSQQKQIGSTGYRPGGGKQYAAFLLKMVDDHAGYTQKVQGLDKQQLSGTDLKHLYEHATELGRTQEANQIAMHGVASDQDHFFMLERYRLLAEQGFTGNDEAVTIKDQLLAADPSNLKLTHYQLAVIDFEASCRQTNQAGPKDPAVAPLIDYIAKFGEQDKENLWRLQMIISQVYFEEDKLPEALKYAQSSYQSAPSTVQPTIGLAIKNIQTKLSH